MIAGNFLERIQKNYRAKRYDRAQIKEIASLVPYCKEKVGICYVNTGSHIERQDGIAGTWSDVFKYQIPCFTVLGISKGDPVSIYLCSMEGSEIDWNSQVRVIARGNNLPDKIIYGPASYNKSREFQCPEKLARIELTQPLLVYDGNYVVVQANSPSIIKSFDSYFQIKTVKIRLYRDWGD